MYMYMYSNLVLKELKTDFEIVFADIINKILIIIINTKYYIRAWSNNNIIQTDTNDYLTRAWGNNNNNYIIQNGHK